MVGMTLLALPLMWLARWRWWESHPERMLGAAGVCLAVAISEILVALVLSKMIKRLILAAMSKNWEVVPAQVASFPDVDTSTLEAYTATFTGLGFHPLMDYTLVYDYPSDLMDIRVVIDGSVDKGVSTHVVDVGGQEPKEVLAMLMRMFPGDIKARGPSIEIQPDRSGVIVRATADQMKEIADAIDCTVRAENRMANPGFARVLVNDLNHCFVEMNQIFPTVGRVSSTMSQLFPAVGRAGPMRCVISSLLEDGWTVSTSDREPSNWSYIMRRPKAVWTSKPGKGPQELLQEHLELREQTTRDLRVQVRTEDTAEAYFEQEKKAADQRKKVVQRRFALAIVLDLCLFDKNPKYQWQGRRGLSFRWRRQAGIQDK
ncbi:MAG TPA: hypothetical protein VH643_38460 [Gemmataceae bacterium]